MTEPEHDMTYTTEDGRVLHFQLLVAESGAPMNLTSRQIAELEGHEVDILVGCEEPLPDALALLLDWPRPGPVQIRRMDMDFTILELPPEPEPSYWERHRVHGTRVNKALGSSKKGRKHRSKRRIKR